MRDEDDDPVTQKDLHQGQKKILIWVGIIGATAALMGALVGGSATIASGFITSQKSDERAKQDFARNTKIEFYVELSKQMTAIEADQREIKSHFRDSKIADKLNTAEETAALRNAFQKMAADTKDTVELETRCAIICNEAVHQITMGMFADGRSIGYVGAEYMNALDDPFDIGNGDFLHANLTTSLHDIEKNSGAFIAEAKRDLGL